VVEKAVNVILNVAENMIDDWRLLVHFFLMFAVRTNFISTSIMPLILVLDLWID
jgi:hypothetical protein